MPRLPKIDRDALPAEHQAIWDGIAAVRSPAMGGPFGVLMHIPDLAARVAHLEDWFRFESSLSPVDRELVILVTAREFEAHYPWARHEARAKEANANPAAIEAIRSKGPVAGLTPREQILIDTTRTLLQTHKIPDDLYQRAVAELGEKPLIEAITLAGNYCVIGLMVTAFDIPEASATF